MARAYTETFLIRALEVDAHREITLPALINVMQEAASNSAEMLGASVYSLQTRGISWAMTRMQLELFELPGHGEKLAVETWPSGYERAFVYRDYRLFTKEGKLIGQATSTWLVLDLATRKMGRLEDGMHPILQVPPDCTPLPRISQRISLPDPVRYESRFYVRRHDLDSNQHVNNGLYFQWAQESLPDDWVAAHRLQEVSVHIRQESRKEDVLVVKSASLEDQQFCHAIYRESDDQLIAQASSKWKKRET